VYDIHILPYISTKELAILSKENVEQREVYGGDKTMKKKKKKKNISSLTNDICL